MFHCTYNLVTRFVWGHPAAETPGHNLADDAGGTGTVPLLSAQNPLKTAAPSPSIEGHFSHSAVAVDSVPCSAIGR